MCFPICGVNRIDQEPPVLKRQSGSLNLQHREHVIITDVTLPTTQQSYSHILQQSVLHISPHRHNKRSKSASTHSSSQHSSSSTSKDLQRTIEKIQRCVALKATDAINVEPLQLPRAYNP